MSTPLSHQNYLFLVEELNRYAKAYYKYDKGIISDFEYDKLCREYDTLINENPGFKFLERKSVIFTVIMSTPIHLELIHQCLILKIQTA